MTHSSNARSRTARAALAALPLESLTRRLRSGAWIAGFLAGLATGTVGASAQSLYGCRDLLSAQLPALEGKDGVFFRVDPDLLMHNRISDEIVGDIGKLSAILTTKGVTLVVVPVPTKALAMPQYLHSDFAKLGYDPVLAAVIYADTLARLAAAGVVAIDARQALSTSVSGETVFFKTDARLSNAGLFALARAISDRLPDLPGYNPPTGTAFITEASGSITLPSPDRLFLQRSCLIPLPEVTTMGFETTHDETEGSVTADDAPAIVIAGTEMTGEPALNFAGFLSELSGFAVAQLAVPQDGLAALSTFLTSDRYQRMPPKYLIWELPVWINSGLRGDQPFREVLAAAQGDCPGKLTVEQTGQNRLRVELGNVPHGAEFSLFLDNSAAPAPRADFHFFSNNGDVRTRPVVRVDGQPLNGRFYMPMTGLWPEGSASVEIETDLAPGNLPKASLCRG